MYSRLGFEVPGPSFDITLSKIIILGLLFVLGVIVCQLIYNGLFHPLSSFPGPFLYGTSELPLRWHQLKGQEPYILAKLHHKYGPVVRIAPNDTSYTNLESWNAIYGYRAAPGGTHLERNLPKEPDLDFYGALGLFSADGEGHARQRRQLAPAFSDRALREQEPLITSYIDRAISRFGESAEARRPIDISAWFNYITFDIIGDLMFGHDVFECVEKSRYHPLVSELLTRFEILTYAIAIQSLAPWLFSVLKFLTPRRVTERQRAQANSIKDMVDRRLQTMTSRPDFMTLILREGKKGDSSLLRNGEIYPTAAQILLAGSETVATALSGCVFLLLRHPDVMAKLKQEIRTGFRSAGEINSSTLPSKKYLLAVINEAMRIYPPNPNFLRRCAPPGGCAILGRFIPSGTAVGFTAFSAYRDESHFKDATEFAPERWLGTDPRYANDNLGVVQHFGVGPMNCIGINLANLELRMILAQLLWKFDIELMPGSDNWFDQKAFVIWFRRPLPVRLVTRDTSE
ncbi:cytochrome P450 [Annulohypoxylon truncatum]|uniref:cytochrome P450 n=1 Tax=Annulohypoxylon truncatum TaxID=327061 RepID=UPI002008B93E|nr:cytochrome P450 [Annulohypoxylon truncatum]KAI1209042.1 cytochrome P450 [Annulohypoxylon truncatum]